MNPSPIAATRRPWPDYAAIWRWHFYAGLFCLPFFCWLALTGSAYVFRPDIDTLLNRPYESLQLDGARAAPSSEARAAVAAMPGSTFNYYELPETATGAARVVVARDGHLYRAHTHPGNLRVMHLGRDDHRLMEVVAHLHGNLLLGKVGSMIVELAGSWGVIMILTGLCLWFPRGTKKLGGLLYPRLARTGRAFWRDLHAVTGLWICTVTLFLLLSGLPWSANWGNYFTWMRNHWSATAGTPDWSLGGNGEPHAAMGHQMHMSSPAKSGAIATINAAEMAAMSPPMAAAKGAAPQGPDLQALDKVIPAAIGLHVPPPVWILPPPRGERDWVISSRIQDRTRRVSYAVDPHDGTVTGRKTFADDNAINRAVNVAIATHEGHLFGRPNQIILLLNALGVLLVTISGAIMWWRRRPAHMLGAPKPGSRPRVASLLAVAVAVLLLTVLLPLFGASLVLVLLIDRLLLSHFPAALRWLGLGDRNATS